MFVKTGNRETNSFIQFVLTQSQRKSERAVKINAKQNNCFSGCDTQSLYSHQNCNELNDKSNDLKSTQT